jgi:proline racemase
MRAARQFTAVDSHTVGAPTRVVTGGLPVLPGATVFEKKRWLETQADHIRRLLMFEPRGHEAMSGSIITPPTHPEADVGVVFIEVSGCLPMCGHGTIGTCTVLVETGMVPVSEPLTHLTLETPAGLVRAEVEVHDGVAQGVTIRNVPSYLAVRDLQVAVEGVGTVTLDVAYGGNFYAILPAEAAGVAVDPARAADIVAVGRRVRDAANAACDVVHPENPGIRGVSHVMFTGPPRQPRATASNAVLYGRSGVDRSPCGTGTSARMAQRHARGEQALHDPFVHESVIGSLFEGRLVKEVMVGDQPGVVPTIRGRAYITGIGQYLLAPDDPFPEGFRIG